MSVRYFTHPDTGEYLVDRRRTVETPREHPPELMAVVDKWQDYANALRKGHLPSYSTQDRTIDALLSEVRRTVAPQVKTVAPIERQEPLT